MDIWKARCANSKEEALKNAKAEREKWLARDAGCELAFADDFDWRKMMLTWISCKDRMPEDGEFFLAYGEKNLGNYIGGPSMDICRWDGQLWSEGGTELVTDVGFTHWMPLPAAPADA